jgi:hypothetical protein
MSRLRPDARNMTIIDASMFSSDEAEPVMSPAIRTASGTKAPDDKGVSRCPLVFGKEDGSAPVPDTCTKRMPQRSCYPSRQSSYIHNVHLGLRPIYVAVVYAA